MTDHIEPGHTSVCKVQSGFIYFYCNKNLFGDLLLKKKLNISIVFFQAVHKVVCCVSLFCFL